MFLAKFSCLIIAAPAEIVICSRDCRSFEDPYYNPIPWSDEFEQDESDESDESEESEESEVDQNETTLYEKKVAQADIEGERREIRDEG
jgi:hypothetical protein